MKVKIVTGVYVLQYNRATFNQHALSPICCLYGMSEEDRVHFVLGCSGLDPVRQTYLKRIQTILAGIEQNIADKIMTNQKLLIQLLMDSSNMEDLNSIQIDDSNYREM